MGLSLAVLGESLEKGLEENNRIGWNLAEVIPDNPKLIIWVIRFCRSDVASFRHLRMTV